MAGRKILGWGRVLDTVRGFTDNFSSRVNSSGKEVLLHLVQVVQALLRGNREARINQVVVQDDSVLVVVLVLKGV